MKKILLFSIFVLLFVIQSEAQYWQIPNPNAGFNPGGLNTDAEYPVGSGLAASWTTCLASSSSPVWSTTQTIPFPFSFNGTAVSDFKVSNSGILTFDVGTALAAPGFSAISLPSALIPNNSICISGLGGIGANDNVVRKTFGTSPNRQLWIFFTSYGYGTTVSDGSNFTYWSIVLDETTNRIHIVDQRTGGYTTAGVVSAGVQIDASTAYSVAGSPALAFLSGTSPAQDDNSFYTFIPGAQPSFDMSVTAITSSPYLSPGNTNFTGTIKNLGLTTITSFNINYKIDGGTPVTATISGVNITSGSTYNFTHNTPWNAVIGTHTLEMYATDLNGSNIDANTFDDSHTQTINVLSELVPRIPLFEIFTSSTCGPCAPGNTNYHSIIDVKPASEFVSIKYQQDFPSTGDPYATTESVNRRTSYYAITSIPRMMIDGGWNSNASAFTTALYDDSRSKPAQYKLNGTYSVNGKLVGAKVKYAPVFNSTGAKLYVAILEGVTSQNVKTNGETEFKHVMKKMLPNETGTNLPAQSPGVWDSTTFTYTFNGEYRLPTDGQSANRINHTTEHSVEEFSDLYVIAWIQGNDKVVYQAANLSLTTGIESVSNVLKDVDVYPNPTQNVINIKINLSQNEQIVSTLVDLEGNVINSKMSQLKSGTNNIDFDATQLASGIYHVMIFDSKGNSSVHKVVVQK
ncbi:MAG TPA: T9SS type A sorting domain-containing protein [Bacteroidia bacterium]|nr:T9SS type A sorting domain-containing protein [Bacteroidia bacterium]